METDLSRRWTKEKGYVTYHPDETYLIHVQWIVLNKKVAKEMIEGLRKCANATHRDTPPVLCYCFRISHDQSLAAAMKEEVKTIEQHPHYIKAYRMLGMNMDPSVMIAKCEREGISSLPLTQNWRRDEPIQPHLDELQFDPVVIDLTELYLDNRSFIDHVGSKDYMEGYSVLMSPHRSLQPYSAVTGTPTPGCWEKVLEPVLKARRANSRLEGLTVRLHSQAATATTTSVSQTVSSSTSSTSTASIVASESSLVDPYVFLEFDVPIPPVTESAQVEQDGSVRLFVESIVAKLNPLFHTMVFNQPQTKYRVMMSCLLSSLTNALLGTSTCTSTSQGNSNVGLFDTSVVAGLPEPISGSAYLFHTDRAGVEECTILQLKEALSACRIRPTVVTQESEAGSEFAGYGLHDKVMQLRQDRSIVCSELA